MSRERIVIARTTLILKHPFFGAIATRMKLKESEEIPTMAVDGRHLFYNNNFINTLSDNELTFVVAHEVLHLVLDHLDRKNERNHRAWNIAVDYAVNAMLKDHRIGEMPKCGLFDEKYKGMSAEEIYAILKDKSDGELDKLAEQVLDEHLTADHKDNQMSDAERKKIKDEIKEAILSAAKNCKEGQVPGCVSRMISELDDPKVDWKSLIKSSIQGLFKNDFSFYRPNKKYQTYGIMLPGKIKQPCVDLFIGMDTSGSIGPKESQAFLSEVSGIISVYQDYKISLFCWDTKISGMRQYDPYSIDSLTEYEMTGGGGTDPTTIKDYLEENDITSDTMIILTDGYFAPVDWDCGKNVIWVVYANTNTDHITSGTIIHIDSF